MFRRMASYEDDIDFRRLWRIGIPLSILACVISIGALVGAGLNLGIDFEGGSVWEVRAPGSTVGDARDALEGTPAADAKIQIVDDEFVRVQAEPSSDEERAEIVAALQELGEIEQEESIGPTWGDEISAKAQRALVYFFIIVAAYISFRLEWKMAVGSLVAVLHDILVSVGVYAVFRFEVTPATVIAFLTILGFSLYDTIVVYDKVSENAKRPAVAQRHTYTGLMNLSLNQVLMRSLNTTLCSVLPVLAILVVGTVIFDATTLREFGIALLVGLISGAYSSIFVAAPVVSWLKEREPRYRAARERLGIQASRRGARGEPPAAPLRTPAAAATSGARSAAEGGATTGTVEAPRPSDRTIPPRPRKQGRRR